MIETIPTYHSARASMSMAVSVSKASAASLPRSRRLFSSISDKKRATGNAAGYGHQHRPPLPVDLHLRYPQYP